MGSNRRNLFSKIYSGKTGITFDAAFLYPRMVRVKQRKFSEAQIVLALQTESDGGRDRSNMPWPSNLSNSQPFSLPTPKSAETASLQAPRSSTDICSLPIVRPADFGPDDEDHGHIIEPGEQKH